MGKVADLYDRSGLNSASPLTSRKAQNSLREEAWEVFKKLDVKNQGKIQITDLQQHLKIMKKAFEDMGVILKDAYFQNLIHDMDENKDGIVTFEEFERTLRKCLDLMHRARTGNLIIPDFADFCENVKQIYEEVKPIKAGKNASYIPQLERMNPEYWGVAVETVDGQQFSWGDDEIDFSIQSCSKPITYCVAMEELGVDEVMKYIGCEPSGARFNSFSLTEENKPFNPFVNTGAIMTCSLIQQGKDMSEKFAHVQNKFSELAGGAKIGFSNSIFLSERNTADRNRALTYFMNEHKAFPPNTNIMDILDFYFQTCSLEVNVKTLASIAATLANGGICPATGRRILSPETVKNCLILLFSCGMYDYSGAWAFNVGLPAKSGVSVIPNVMGLCTFSPRLDFRGNSVRGIEFCRILAKKYNFHIFTQLVGTDPTQHNMYKEKVANTTAPPSADVANRMFAAIQKGDIQEVQKLLHLNRNELNKPNNELQSPLQYAVKLGKDDIARYLTENGADVNQYDKYGHCPLDEATKRGNASMINFLIAHGETEPALGKKTTPTKPGSSAATKGTAKQSLDPLPTKIGTVSPPQASSASKMEKSKSVGSLNLLDDQNPFASRKQQQQQQQQYQQQAQMKEYSKLPNLRQQYSN